jgi:phosphoribosylanthranilate isomerase
MIQVKICGITNKDEIEYINKLKPEYIGFVFTKSKRQVTGEKSRELFRNLNKEVKIVGVFKDNSIEEILNILKEIPLDVIQLHGEEDETFISKLKNSISKSTKIWKALSISDTKNITLNVQNKENKLIDNFLIDGDNPGSGETFSLENIGELLGEGLNNEYNFFLAGGITPENVIERAKKANPIGIDVSSGIEIIDENGIRTKSFEKMKSLIEKVRTLKNNNIN